MLSDPSSSSYPGFSTTPALTDAFPGLLADAFRIPLLFLLFTPRFLALARRRASSPSSLPTVRMSLLTSLNLMFVKSLSGVGTRGSIEDNAEELGWPEGRLV